MMNENTKAPAQVANVCVDRQLLTVTERAALRSTPSITSSIVNSNFAFIVSTIQPSPALSIRAQAIYSTTRVARNPNASREGPYE
jgi:hypothetical protein